jgi:ribosomal protein L37AE/L43A
VSAQQIAVLLAGESPASRAALEEFFPAAAVLAAATEVHVNVDVPAGFVPDFVVTNRATKAVTFNGGQLGQLVTCPRCDKRMTQRMPDEWKCACGVSCTAEGARSEHVRAGFAASKRRAAEAATVPNEKEQAALAFCFRAAAGDSGGQRRVRKFLFAWHNAGELGGFDFADLWSLDEQHLAAVLTLINMIARGQTGYYPHHYGYEADMEALIETYGPEVRS